MIGGLILVEFGMNRGFGFERQSMGRSDTYLRSQNYEPLQRQSETRRTVSAKDLSDEAAFLSWPIVNDHVTPFYRRHIVAISGRVTACAGPED